MVFFCLFLSLQSKLISGVFTHILRFLELWLFSLATIYPCIHPAKCPSPRGPRPPVVSHACPAFVFSYFHFKLAAACVKPTQTRTIPVGARAQAVYLRNFGASTHDSCSCSDTHATTQLTDCWVQRVRRGFTAGAGASDSHSSAEMNLCRHRGRVYMAAFSLLWALMYIYIYVQAKWEKGAPPC